MTKAAGRDPVDSATDLALTRPQSLIATKTVIFGGVWTAVIVVTSLLFAIWGHLNLWTVSLSALVAFGTAGWIAAKQTAPVIALPPPRALVAAVLIAGSFTVWAGVNAAEHVFSDRDPGVYHNTTAWLVGHGTLLIEGAGDPFPDSDDLQANWLGFFDDRGDGLVYARFSHGMPTVAASGALVFGDWVINWMNPVLGGLVLIFLVMLLFTHASAPISVLLVGVTSANLAFYSFFRDTFSEPLVFLLVVLGILGLWIAHESKEPWALYAAAAAIGATTSVRLDAWLFVVGFLGLLILWLVGPSRRRIGAAPLLGAAVVCVAFTATGAFDLAARSPIYVSDLSNQVVPLIGLFVAAAFAVAATYAARRRLRLLLISVSQGRWPEIRPWLGGATVVVGLTLLVIRPAFFPVTRHYVQATADLFAEAGLPPDGTRTLAEYSLQWFAWYWGWVVVVAAIIGIGLLVGRRLQRWSALGVAMTVVAVPLVVYLWRPSIYPDHVWAMRRMLIPGTIALLIGVAVAAEWLLANLKTQDLSSFVKKAPVAVGAVVLVASTVAVSPKMHMFSRQEGMAGATAELCAALPYKASVAVFGTRLGRTYAPTIRTFCDVPVATFVGEPSIDRLAAIASVVEDEGFSLVFVSDGGLDFGGFVVSEGAVRYPVTGHPIFHPPTIIKHELHEWRAEVVPGS